MILFIDSCSEVWCLGPELSALYYLINVDLVSSSLHCGFWHVPKISMMKNMSAAGFPEPCQVLVLHSLLPYTGAVNNTELQQHLRLWKPQWTCSPRSKHGILYKALFLILFLLGNFIHVLWLCCQSRCLPNLLFLQVLMFSSLWTSLPGFP